jgi:hypothetical protein
MPLFCQQDNYCIHLFPVFIPLSGVARYRNSVFL